MYYQQMSLASETTAYLAAPELEAQLRHELADVLMSEHGRLFICSRPAMSAVWSLNTWGAVESCKILSIKQAAQHLRDRQRNWAKYAHVCHRRMLLIEENLPHVSGKPLVFPKALPTASLGSWTLLDEQNMLFSQHCSAAMPNGEIHFVEDKHTPPNRAYLKLWEAFTRIGYWPKAGEFCIDLGASPGGWSWVCQKLGARVLSVDKAELTPEIAALTNIEFLQQSAFALSPQDLPPCDWLLCDIICYPDKMLSYISKWRESGRAKNIICTFKFQGETDFNIIAKIKDSLGGTLQHLFHNKHELTWMYKAEAD